MKLRGKEYNLGLAVIGFQTTGARCIDGCRQIVGEVTCDELASRPGWVEKLLVVSCDRNGISSGSYEPVGSKASLWHLLGMSICTKVTLFITYSKEWDAIPQFLYGSARVVNEHLRI